jgi:hypothetical protein
LSASFLFRLCAFLYLALFLSLSGPLASFDTIKTIEK